MPIGEARAPVNAIKPAARYLTFPSFSASSAPMAAETLTASSAMGAASVSGNCKPKTSSGTAIIAPPAPVSPSITPTRAPKSAATIETVTVLDGSARARKPLAALQEAVPVKPGQELRLEQPGKVTRNRRFEPESRKQLATIPELGKNDLALFHGERTGAVSIVERWQIPSFPRCQQVFRNNDDLLSDSCSGLRVGGGAYVPEREDVGMAGVPQCPVVDLTPSGGVRQRAFAHEIRRHLGWRNVQHVEGLFPPVPRFRRPGGYQTRRPCLARLS